MNKYRIIMTNGMVFDVALRKDASFEQFLQDLSSARWKIIGLGQAIQTSQIVAIVPGEQLVSKVEDSHD